MSNGSRVSPAKITALLNPERINLNVQATQKVDALREVASLLAHHHALGNFDVFFREILEREKVSNTALGHDVAIPHARTDQCNEILMAVGRSANGIEFEAKDGQPVRLIFLIGTPKHMVTDYLRVVGNLARLLRHDDLRRRLIEAADPSTFIQIIEQAES
jgi:mannitol/fructose-specific phosphotransferase system IIA component (Ntr-type)